MQDDRLTEIEMKVAFQEHTLAQLDEEIRKAMTRIEQLERRLTELQQEHAASLPAPENTKPPHY